MRNNAQILKTVERAADVLWLFSSRRSGLSLKEVAAELGMPKSVAHRLCSTLVHVGLLRQDPDTRRYRCGLRVLELTSAVLDGFSLRGVALPYMHRVLQLTGESVFLNVVSGVQSVCIEKVEPDSALRVTYSVGYHAPLHAGAPGKLLLAFQPQEFQERVLAGPLVRFTPHTVTDPALLRAQLTQIRATGVAWSIGELTPDVGAVSVPVRCDGDHAVAALTVAGVATRYGGRSRGVFAEVLLAVAGEMNNSIRHLDRRALLGT